MSLVIDKFRHYLIKYKLIILILLAAFTVRIIGLDYGLPHQFVADEFLMVAVSLKMLDAHSLIPNFPEVFYHQPLSAYISVLAIGLYLAWQFLSGGFASLAAMKEFYLLNAGNLLIVVRFASVLFGVGMVFLLYLIGKDLFNKRVGLIAAFFGAFEFISVQIHHSARVWGFLEFFVALALWASVKVLLDGSLKNYIKSALASVLAIATLLPGIFTFIPTIFSNFSFKNKKLWWGILIVLIGLLLVFCLNPRGLGVLLLRFGLVGNSQLNEFVFSSASISALHLSTDTLLSRVVDPIKTLFFNVPIYLLLAVIGLVFLRKTDKKKFWFLSSFLISYYLFIGPFFAYGKIVRTLLPLVIYLLIIAAFTADKLLVRFRVNNKIAVAACLLALSSYSIGLTVLYDSKIVKTDTRIQAVDWTEKNITANSKIMVFSIPNELLNQNYDVLNKINEVAPASLSTKQKYLLENKKAENGTSYYAWDLNKISASSLPKNFFKDNGFQYYMRTRWGTENENQFKDVIEKEFSSMELLAVFKPLMGGDNLKDNFPDNIVNPIKVLAFVDRFGPIVEVYKIRFK